MKSKIILYLIIIFINFEILAKPKVITSITPIASILKMIIGDIVDIEAVNITSGCPHHYRLRPSDKEKVKNADVAIYIDDHFDGFFPKVLNDFSGKKIKISEMLSINFKDDSGQKNWHFWLDLDNVLVFQKELSKIFINIFPEHKENIESHLAIAEKKIHSIKSLKTKELYGIKGLVILSDSLEHFFKNSGINIVKLYQSSNNSLRSMNLLEKTVTSDNTKCLVIDLEQNINLYGRFNKPIIQLDSENWVDSQEMLKTEDLLESKYISMINALKKCK